MRKRAGDVVVGDRLTHLIQPDGAAVQIATYEITAGELHESHRIELDGKVLDVELVMRPKTKLNPGPGIQIHFKGGEKRHWLDLTTPLTAHARTTVTERAMVQGRVHLTLETSPNAGQELRLNPDQQVEVAD